MPRPALLLSGALPTGLVLAGLFLAGCSQGRDTSRLGLLRDADADGLPDSLELALGSDPGDPDDPFREGAQDDPTPEGPGPDGIPDGLERYLLQLGARPPVTARTDSDADGIPDALEVRSGLDPRDPDVPVPSGNGDRDDPAGPAFDGIPDGLESYLLRRGARPPLTGASDSDGDGLPDVLEVRSGSSPFDARDPSFARATDLDGDQVPDWLELRAGFDPLNADFPTFDGADDDDGGALGPDGDGVMDGLEGWLVRAGAAAPLTMATDSDGDGIPDVVEVRAGSEPFDAASPLAGGARDDDLDGIPDGLELLLLRAGARTSRRDTDSDGDRVPDFAEALSGSSPFDPSEPWLFSHFDLDGDGLVDFLEHQEGSDPSDADSPLPGGGRDENDASGPPRDALSDALEALLVARGARAPVTSTTDSDGDGVPDLVELHWVSDPFDPDSPLRGGAGDLDDASGPPGDGLSDAAELVLGAFGPGGAWDTLRNSDADVIPDALELLIGSNWLDGASPSPRRSPDADGDGATDWLELELGFDPLSPDEPLPDGARDSDQDGLSDALEELLLRTGTAAPVEPTSDSDGDGLYDVLELALASGRHDADSPLRDGGLDRDDRTGPAGDGLSDALELFLVRSGAARPVTTRTDSDGDRVPDYLELRLALDAFDAESPLVGGRDDADGDAVSNALELVLERLGAHAPVDALTDSDGDRVPDYLEVFAGRDAFDGDDPLPGGGGDPDGDGIPEALELVLAELGSPPPVTPRSDADGDGIPDGYEVRAGTDPLRGDHPLVDGGSDVRDDTGPADRVSDALEHLLLLQGATPPLTHASDSDADGAPDHLEVFAGSLPFDPDDPVVSGAFDADGDRLPDALEAVLLALGAADPVRASSDTDGDGAPDFLEVQSAAHPIDADVPLVDGAASRFDSDASTGPNGDGVSDALELLLVRLGCALPVTREGDTDLDGLPDAFEARVGTNPVDGDSPLPGGGADADDATGPAGDGISDALEAFLIAAGASGPVTVATDTDGDGVPDVYEVFKGSDPLDAGDTLAPGVPPRAGSLAVSGVALEGRTLTGSYVYSDADFDPEGATELRWLRNGLEIPGETGAQHEIVAADVGTVLTFEVTPVARLAYPPETARGPAARLDRVVTAPTFPRGSGGPAGIGSTGPAGSVGLWLKADEGVVTSGSSVTRWRDQSGRGRDARAGAAPGPELVSGVGPRGAAALRFDGTSQLVAPHPVQEDFTLAVAFLTDDDALIGGSLEEAATFLGADPQLCGLGLQIGLNGGKPQLVVLDASLIGVGNYADGLPHSLVASRVRANLLMRLYMDGIARGSRTVGADPLTCPAEVLLGSWSASQGYLVGDVFEICAFERALNAAERRLLDAYFALRFGVPAPVPLYLFETHAGDLAGIGRESSAAQVTEAEGPGILRVSGPTALSDGDYLLWGTDRPGDFSLSGDAPAAFGGRLARTWRWQLTDGGGRDGVGVVDLRFRLTGLALSQEREDYALLFDDDGDFSNARVVQGTFFHDAATETVEFLDVVVGPERFFTLAVRERP